MTSRDRYNAWLLGKSGIIETRLEVWQAAERDMLERCVEAVKKERLTDNTDESTNLAYNTAISHVVYKLKELLNEQQ